MRPWSHQYFLIVGHVAPIFLLIIISDGATSFLSWHIVQTLMKCLFIRYFISSSRCAKVPVYWYTVKPVLSGHSKGRLKYVFKTNCRLMQVESIAEFCNTFDLQIGAFCNTFDLH